MEQLQSNLAALVDALNKARPAAAKGVYLRKLAVSSTMGGGARVELVLADDAYGRPDRANRLPSGM